MCKYIYISIYKYNCIMCVCELCTFIFINIPVYSRSWARPKDLLDM